MFCIRTTWYDTGRLPFITYYPIHNVALCKSQGFLLHFVIANIKTIDIHVSVKHADVVV